jgi:pimeloyl-ACP methyl ester carboxylesterase
MFTPNGLTVRSYAARMGLGQRQVWAAGALLIGFLLSGCASATGEAVSAVPDGPLLRECSAVPDGARRVTLVTDDGVRLGAAALGPAQASRGVVVAHGASQTLCDWLDVGQRLAERADALVLLVDRRGVGSSEAGGSVVDYPRDVIAGQRWLTAQGVRQVSVVGSSAGTPVALAAADPAAAGTSVDPAGTRYPAPDRTPCSVVLVSPIAMVGGTGGSIGLSGRRGLGVPLWTAAEGDNPAIVAAARDVARELAPAATRGRQLVVAGTRDHSIGLVEHHPEALELLVAATTSCG